VAEPPADACLVPAGAHLPVLRECRRPHQAGSSRPGPFAHAPAAAFGHSLQDALAVNIGLIAAALALAAFGPRKVAMPGAAGAAVDAPVPAAKA